MKKLSEQTRFPIMAQRSKSMKPGSQAHNTVQRHYEHPKSFANVGAQVTTMTGMRSLPTKNTTQAGGISTDVRGMVRTKQPAGQRNPAVKMSVVNSISGVGTSGLKSRNGVRKHTEEEAKKQARDEKWAQERATKRVEMRESEKLYQGIPSTGVARREERPYRADTVERVKQEAVERAKQEAVERAKQGAVERTKQEAKPVVTHFSGQLDSAAKPKQEVQLLLKPEYQNLIMTPGQMSSKNQEFKPKPIAEVSSKPAEAVISPSPIVTHDPAPRSELINTSSSHLPNPPTQPFLTPKKDSPDSLASQSTTETVTRPPSARKRQDFSTNAMSTMTAIRTDDTVVAGLRNFGNVCFMNAVLQCLSFTPRIEEALQGNINEAAKTEGELVRAVRELLQDMRQGRYATLSVIKVKEVISTVAPQFRDYTQHDAQEFLRVLLDALHEELNRGSKAAKAPKLSRILENAQKLDDLASIWWQENLRRDSSGLTDLFQGQLMHILTCGNCHNSTYTFEVFLDLSLPIPVTERSRYSSVGCSLQQCFEEFTSEKEIEGVKCKRCGPQVCKGKMLVHRFPKVLVLHLKRFTMELDSDGKIKAPVTCPASQLDLSKYTLRVPSPRYDLYAIAHHIGDIDYGHYYA